MEKIGLVLEGGAMRGVYTAGVLDYLMKKELYFPYCIGVSAGACQAFSYISGQKGRNREITRRYIRDPRYLSYRNLLLHGGFFGFDFIFGDVAKKLLPFDAEAFQRSPQEFVIGVTDCKTGRAEYYRKSEASVEKMYAVCEASSSMPLAAKPVHLDGRVFMDGGVSDSIPVRQALLDGCDRVVCVLTRNRGYRKKPAGASLRLAKRAYPMFPGLLASMEMRYQVYNDTIALLEKMEQAGRAFLIRPQEAVHVRRIEKNPKKLFAFYREGFLDTRDCYQNLKKWLKNS